MRRSWRMAVCTALCTLCSVAPVHADDEAPAFHLADPDEAATPEPDSAEVKGTTASFRWKPVRGADGYRLQVGRSLLFSPVMLDVVVKDARAQQPIASLPKNLCYWRVAVVHADGSEGPFSSARVLNLRTERGNRSLIPAPVDDDAPPPIMQPAQGDRVMFGSGKTTKVAFRWAGILKKARIELATDREFTRITHRALMKKGASVTLATGEYCWRMSHPAGTPRWSEPQCFSVVTDTEPPVLSIASPGSQLYTPHSLVTIQGVTEPGSKVTINRARIRLQQRGEFRMLMPLSRGKNTFRLTARDAYGNTSSKDIVVTVVPRDVYVRVFVRVKRLQQNIQEVERLRVELDNQNQELQKLMMRGNAATEELATELLSVEKETRELKTVRQQLEDEVAVAARSLETAAAELARVR